VRRHVRSLGLLALASTLVLAACGSDSTPGASSVTRPPSSTTTAADGHVANPASAEPSVSAKMICEAEVIDDLAGLFGLKPIAPVTPTWNDHVYACTYEYRGGNLTLSVKELVDRPATDEYFGSLAEQLGKSDDINGLGEGAFTTKDDSVVVRKDFKVLLVDISELPAEFGNPPDSSDNIALNVASVIMGCWTGV
jgi:hypothetical protein